MCRVNAQAELRPFAATVTALRECLILCSMVGPTPQSTMSRNQSFGRAGPLYGAAPSGLLSRDDVALSTETNAGSVTVGAAIMP